MNFDFLWQKQYYTHSLRSTLDRKILFCHSKMKFISSRHCVISSIYFMLVCQLGLWSPQEGGRGGYIFTCWRATIWHTGMKYIPGKYSYPASFHFLRASIKVRCIPFCRLKITVLLFNLCQLTKTVETTSILQTDNT